MYIYVQRLCVKWVINPIVINVFWSNESLIGVGLLQIFVISVATQVSDRCFSGGKALKSFFGIIVRARSIVLSYMYFNI